MSKIVALDYAMGKATSQPSSSNRLYTAYPRHSRRYPVGYFCWLLVSAGQSNFCIYQFSRKLQTTLSFGVFEFETKTWKHLLFSIKFGRLTNLVVLKLNSKPIF